ncbi:MAG: hypothetical protein AAGL99_04075 [Pseudomonadota bacterium]
MSKHDAACLQRAWPIICQLVSLLQIYVPQLRPEAPRRGHWLHLTRLAESLVRRWLVLKACESAWPEVGGDGLTRVIPESASALVRDLGPSQTKLGPGHSRGSENSGMTTSNPRPPHFRLTEPEPIMPVFTYDPVTDCYILDYPRSRSTLELTSVFNPENLRRRCAALQAVIDDPAAHILRMARWLSRAASRRQRQACRPHPLGTGAPPGASRHQRRHDPERQNLLTYLNDLARDAVARCGGP